MIRSICCVASAIRICLDLLDEGAQLVIVDPKVGDG